jgi:hypothetical protein
MVSFPFCSEAGILRARKSGGSNPEMAQEMVSFPFCYQARIQRARKSGGSSPEWRKRWSFLRIVIRPEYYGLENLGVRIPTGARDGLFSVSS